ncbi:MAG: hypothetical protein ACD_22C00256G0001 [uncultured bacterium]|nr:MAG: hypothetical protein ACD_22C00256G0001 [uncultured bacterium]
MIQRLKALYYIFYKSLTSPVYYKDIIAANMNLSIKYFLTLTLVLSVIGSAVMSVKVAPTIQKDVKNITETVLEVYPQDLVINVEDGKIKLNREEPVIIKFPQSKEKTSETNASLGLDSNTELENLVVLDPKGTIEDLDKYNTLILINETNILARNASGQIDVQPLKDLPNGEFTREKLEESMKRLGEYANALPLILFLIGVGGSLVINSVTKFLVFFAMALALKAATMVYEINLPYFKLLQIIIHTFTAPFIMDTVLSIFNLKFPLPYWQFMLGLLIAGYVLVRIGGDYKAQPGLKKVEK